MIMLKPTIPGILMPDSETQANDAIVIGGGFYGAAIASYLSNVRGLKNVMLVEKEASLLSRASYNNQARVHNGYHYPRSFTTAYRSRINLPKFVRDWPEAITRDFTKLYAIARRNSKVTAKQFERFCFEIDAKIQKAPQALQNLFEDRLIENVYLVEEYAFNSAKLENWARKELAGCGVNVVLNTKVTDISHNSMGWISTTLESLDGLRYTVQARKVFNCTYSGLNQFGGDYMGVKARLKHEITELALIKVPPVLDSLGVTVMDGPFFSMMPFPSRELHSLSHVRYTPHMHWEDRLGIDPYERLDKYECQTRVDRMIRDAGRYMPSVLSSRYIESLFEIKTVLEKNEIDDGRPILFQKHAEIPGCYSVLGGKIDNIYDVLEKLDEEIM